MITTEIAATYLRYYIQRYRHEYQRFTAPQPTGGGYPNLRISPYLYSSQLNCYLANDGVAIADFTWQPEYRWEIAGGPALLVDYPQTKVPEEITELLKNEGILGQNIGISRIVSETGFDDEVWKGYLPEPIETLEDTIDEQTQVRILRFDLSWHMLIQRLTFGAFCKILDLHLPGPESDLWPRRVITDLGFVTADRQNKRFFHYLELSPHVDESAWDIRSIWARVHLDIQRDFKLAIGKAQRPGGAISMASTEALISPYTDRLSALADAIERFEQLLDERGDEDESVFHEFLQAHPVLLDVYGEAVSKPKLRYPQGESPLGKEYVEPDFILRYPGNTYKLVELEKPNKAIATKQGQPRAEVTQTTFQIAEWQAYIRNHYELLKNDYPGISIRCSTMVVIGRATEKSIGTGRDVKSYMELINLQYRTDDVLLYDDLLDRAKQAYAQLSALAVTS